MKPPTRRESALNRLLSEARAERTGKVDFDGVEERLMREVRRGPPQASRGARTWAWASVAVAACAALWLTRRHTPTTATETPCVSTLRAKAPETWFDTARSQ